LIEARGSETESALGAVLHVIPSVGLSTSLEPFQVKSSITPSDE
jgi:hypothetical protein